MRKLVTTLTAVGLAMSLGACGESVTTDDGSEIITTGATTDKNGDPLPATVAEPVAVAKVKNATKTIHKFEFRDGDMNVVCYSTALNAEYANLSCDREPISE